MTTTARSAGANVKAVQRMLGHAKASMTLDVYADLFDEDLDGVADRLDAAIRSTADRRQTTQNANGVKISDLLHLGHRLERPLRSPTRLAFGFALCPNGDLLYRNHDRALFCAVISPRIT
jgi:hypothetical protein